MAKKKDNPDSRWTRSIEKMTFGLSDSQPVRLIRHHWSDCHVSQYDMHYGLEVGLILSGKMKRHYQNFQMDIGSGQLWLCGMWEPHGFELIKAPCSALVFIIFPPMLANTYFEEGGSINWLAPFQAQQKSRPQVPERFRQRMLELGEDLFEFSANEESHEKALLRLKLLEIIMFLQKDWQPPIQGREQSPDSLGKINNALQLVFENKCHVSAIEAAKACKMHRNSFRNIFKELMGISFPEFSLRYRLSSAAIELLNNNGPIKKIAYDWGFADPSHFYHSFAKYYGCSPTLYRQSRR